MSLKQQIDNDIKKAMLAKQKEELEALRSIKSLILLAETEKGGSGDVSTDVENKLLMKAAKQRKESAEIFQQQGRADLAEKELFQLSTGQNWQPVTGNFLWLMRYHTSPQPSPAEREKVLSLRRGFR